MLFLNHTCEPNGGFGSIILVAMRDIEVGEELTTDYALFDDYDGGMDRACGRAACRGYIDGGTGLVVLAGRQHIGKGCTP
jgi:hypothetical protein